jgi:cytochrome P450
MSLLAELDRSNVVDVDLGSAEFKANAHRHMAEWARRRPFYVLGNGPSQVVVGRYADVHRVFSDTDTFKSEMPRGPGWEQFSDSELFDQIFGICGASLSATSRAAGGALYLLYTHPEQLDQLIRNPALIPDALEECFRLASNGYFTFPRIAIRDTEVGGTPILKAWWCGRRRSPRTTIPMCFLTRRASTFVASQSGYYPSVRARITASATSSAALPSPLQSAACRRAFLRRI